MMDSPHAPPLRGSLPPEGADPSWGGPATDPNPHAPPLRGSLPPEGADPSWGGPATDPSPHAPPLRGSLPPEGADPSWGGPATDRSQEADLSPLAWVHEEVQRSVHDALQAVQRFAQAHRQARLTDLSVVDESELRMARQHLHQAVGALEMVGLGAPAQVLRAMEAAAQRFGAKPELCDDAALITFERVATALGDFLQRRVRQRAVADLALYPAYRDVAALAGWAQAHPADLWALDHHGVTLPPVSGADPASAAGAPVAYGPALRAQLDRQVLQVVKSLDTTAAAALARLALALSAVPPPGQARVPGAVGTFWQVAAAYFESVAHAALPADVHTRRAASRVLLQYAALAQGRCDIPDALLHELLYLCAQARPPVDRAPAWAAVAHAYGLQRHTPVDVEQVQLGLFDPGLMAQAQSQVRSFSDRWARLNDTPGTGAPARDTWVEAALALGRAVTRVAPALGPLVQAFAEAVPAPDDGAMGGPEGSVHPQLALEVATGLLFLQATLAEWDPGDPDVAERAQQLAQRVHAARAGQTPPPLAPWIEQLYRRWSERQTVGGVVTEVRRLLGEAEALFDRLARGQVPVSDLAGMPQRLSQLLGVFQMLDLPDAARAAQSMRSAAEGLLSGEVTVDAPAWRRLVNNLGALGFLVDVLGWDPASAQRGFVFDADAAELRPLLAPTSRPARTEPPPAAETNPPTASPGPAAELPGPAQEVADDDAAELRTIFIDEAQEVLASAQAAVRTLAEAPAQWPAMTHLRRAFHTLKGSARMVGLSTVGEAAWAMEQVLNARLADQTPADVPLLDLCRDALAHLDGWIATLAQGGAEPAPERAQAVARSSLALREQGIYLPLDSQELAPPVSDEQAEVPAQTVEDMVAPPAAVAVDDAPAAAADQPAEAPDEASVAAEVTEGAASADAPVDAPVAEAASEAGPEAAPEPSSEPASELTPPASSEAAPALLPEPPPEPPPEPRFEAFDEQVKVVGPLRIPLALFNVYLNEADEWSRALCQGLGEWAIGPEATPPAASVAWAHSLAGSSMTVGFEPLGLGARALEHAIEALLRQPPPPGQRLAPQARQLPLAVAEMLRQMLHQFAAGFFKASDTELLARLADWPRPGDWVPMPGLQVVGGPAPMPAAAARAAEAPVDTPAASAHGPADQPDADLFHVFEEEALDLMPRLGGALRQWVARPDNDSARAEVLRNLHTLKGSARLAGAMGLGELAHQMETAAEAIGRSDDEAPALQQLLARFDGLSERLEQLRRGQAADSVAGAATPGLPDHPAEALPGQADGAPATATVADVPAPGGSDDATPPLPDLAAEPPPAEATAARTPHGVWLPRVPVARVAPLSSASVRVRPELLDRLMSQVGDVMLTRSRMEDELHTLRSSLQDLTGNLARLRQQLRELELQTETQLQSRQAHNLQAGRAPDASFDPLEFDRYTRVQELTRIMAESVNDVATVQRNLQRAVDVTEDGLVAQGRQSRELQRDLLRTRMVEVDTVAERLHRVVRQAASESGRQARLEVTGPQIEMDRSVLERMVPAFEHLLRNAVVHGIEAPPARQAAGKPPEGVVQVALSQEGNDVLISVADDGAGLDLSRLRERAQAMGRWSAADEASGRSPADLVFEPGLSTVAQVSELAGRGIGLDVVRNEVLALGGRIDVHSAPGQGCRFELVLPLTTAVTQVVLLRAGDFTWGVPAALVEQVHRLDGDIVRAAGPVGELAPAGTAWPLYWAGALLQQSTASRESARLVPVLQLRSANQRVLLHVDEVLGNQEVVVKHLGPQLARLPGVAGMTVLASGAVAVIYNPVALAVVYGESTREWLRQAAGGAHRPAGPATPLVLVVDDSITVRRVTQRLLQREGYRVALANDGAQALERMRDEAPVVVLSDIEMPGMDGFELVQRMRADPSLKDLPVVMITSRIADKHREHARELGVDHYLGKPYAEETLLALVSGYARLAAPR